jgi:uncharacterized protein (DUF488 family)
MSGGRKRERTVFTIGHSTRSFDELVEVLQAHRIRVLADIRTMRRSRTNPQFNEETFGPALAAAGIRYVAMPALGGLRGKTKREGTSPNDGWEVAAFRNYADYAETSAFDDGLRALMSIASAERTAIMCAEAVWWRCHRRIVADHLLARGVRVVHLFTKTHEEEATLTPFAVVGPRGRVRYPASA